MSTATKPDPIPDDRERGERREGERREYDRRAGYRREEDAERDTRDAPQPDRRGSDRRALPAPGEPAGSVSPSGGWVSVASALPDRRAPLLVTNNIDARDAHGEMSHVWLTRMLHPVKSEGDCDAGCQPGAFHAFAEPAGSRVHGVSHWRYALPASEDPAPTPSPGGAAWWTTEKVHGKLRFSIGGGEVMQTFTVEVLDGHDDEPRAERLAWFESMLRKALNRLATARLSSAPRDAAPTGEPGWMQSLETWCDTLEEWVHEDRRDQSAEAFGKAEGILWAISKFRVAIARLASPSQPNPAPAPEPAEPTGEPVAWLMWIGPKDDGEPGGLYLKTEYAKAQRDAAELAEHYGAEPGLLPLYARPTTEPQGAPPERSFAEMAAEDFGQQLARLRDVMWPDEDHDEHASPPAAEHIVTEAIARMREPQGAPVGGAPTWVFPIEVLDGYSPPLCFALCDANRNYIGRLYSREEADFIARALNGATRAPESEAGERIEGWAFDYGGGRYHWSQLEEDPETHRPATLILHPAVQQDTNPQETDR